MQYTIEQVDTMARELSGGRSPDDLKMIFEARQKRYASPVTVPVTPGGSAHMERIATPVVTQWPCDPRDFLSDVAWVMRRDKFEVLPEQKIYIRKLATYFSGNEMEGGYDLNKGIFLFGGCGAGKTTLFKIFQDVRRFFGFPLYVSHTPTIYANFLAAGNVDFGPYLCEERCFDDAGAEQMEIMSFGNRIHILPQIIILRYELFQRDGIKTHFTSNLTPVEMVARTGFDERVKSRMNEMFNIVNLPGADWRKK